jgi:tripartite-type tricarboxylate transporter receptor subunit TctC
VAESLHDDDVVKRFNDVGAQPVGSTPAQFADYLKKEDAKWGEVVRKGNIKLD